MDQIITILTKVIYTLNHVEVRGKENLDSMLGCIQALERLKTALSREEETHETDHKQG